MPEALPAPAEVLASAHTVGVELTLSQGQALVEFAVLLQRWNRAFNLVSRRDVARLVPRHLIDSLTVVPWLLGSEVLDLGTGAGLPGVPLAIAREDVHFTLIDTSERKIRFLGQAVRTLGLGNVTLRCSDVRGLPPEAVYDTVVCRAVSPPASVWALAAPRLSYRQSAEHDCGGRLVIMSRTRTGRNVPPTQRRSPSRPLPGSAEASEGEQVAGEAAARGLPADARLEAVHRVHVPGLPEPHELMLVRRRPPLGPERGRSTP